MLFFTIALFAASTLVIAAPLPDGGSAYTGAGGQAIGGTAGNNGDNGFGADALNIASGNAGDGGDASSGTAFGGFGGRGNGGSAYSGVGGIANGGGLNNNDANSLGYYGWGGDSSALNVASDNAGSGGDASSGNAFGGGSY